MWGYWWALMAYPSGWFVVNFPPPWNIVKRLASVTIINLSHAVGVVKNPYVTIRPLRSTSTFFEVLLRSTYHSLRSCTCSPIEFQTELIFTWQTSTPCKKKFSSFSRAVELKFLKVTFGWRIVVTKTALEKKSDILKFTLKIPTTGSDI